MQHVTGLLLVAVLGLISCRDEYVPPLVQSDTNVLVVDGNLNVGTGPTSFRLSRSGPVDGNNTIIAEEGAQVQVESETGGGIQLLPAVGGGIYRGNPVFSVGQRYRVRIITTGGREYVSAYVTALQTPEIDSISWKRDEEGITVYANTHGNGTGDTYYRWEYDETWEIRSYWFSEYVYENKRVRQRNLPQESVLTCWKYNTSKNILLGTTAKLQSDRISEAPLLEIANGDERPAVRYSILVRQYALDKEAFEFYDLMKKNTESIGSIFDPQPSEIRGNFTSVTDPAEPVIGFLTASSVTEKRIFVNAAQVPDWRFVEYCPTQNVTPDSVEFYFEGEGYMPYGAKDLNGGIEYYYGSYGGCVDCRKRGGNLNRPSYW